jgi:hypothetical protein
MLTAVCLTPRADVPKSARRKAMRQAFTQAPCWTRASVVGALCCHFRKHANAASTAVHLSTRCS